MLNVKHAISKKYVRNYKTIFKKCKCDKYKMYFNSRNHDLVDVRTIQPFKLGKLKEESLGTKGV